MPLHDGCHRYIQSLMLQQPLSHWRWMETHLVQSVRCVWTRWCHWVLHSLDNGTMSNQPRSDHVNLVLLRGKYNAMIPGYNEHSLQQKEKQLYPTQGSTGGWISNDLSCLVRVETMFASSWWPQWVVIYSYASSWMQLVESAFFLNQRIMETTWECKGSASWMVPILDGNGVFCPPTQLPIGDIKNLERSQRIHQTSSACITTKQLHIIYVLMMSNFRKVVDLINSHLDIITSRLLLMHHPDMKGLPLLSAPAPAAHSITISFSLV